MTESTQAATPSGAEELRGTVTVMFTDVEGSTDLRTRVGDDAAHRLLRSHEDLVRREIEERGGRHVKALGDGFMAVFTSARTAVSCAVGIQQALEQVEGVGGDLRVRVGLNAGEVIEEAGDVYGQAVNAAARIAAKAKGGQILAGEVVRQLAGTLPDVSFSDRGLFWLRGFPERWRLCEVEWRDGGSRAVRTSAPLDEQTPFVGREAERADLHAFIDQAIGGQGALVLLGGEPGVGKTRLAREMAEEAVERGMTHLVGHCYEMEGAPAYLPFVEILEDAARHVSMEALREALGDSASEVARILPELRRRFPDIPPPTELPPDQARRYLFNSIRELLDRASRMQPLLILLDDLHWADESSLLLLQHIAASLPSMPVLLLGTYRDVELEVTRPLARTIEDLLRRRQAHRIHLRRLPEEEVGALLAALGGSDPPASLVRAIHEETEGNPFFVEEVFRHLAEEGKLLDETGRWRADLRIGELDVPESVRLVIGRRLERLSEEARGVLTAAAVIGRAFGFDLLEALGDADPDTLLDAIDEAERARLVTSESDGGVRFTFAHELIRQTLLAGTSALRRQRLHLRVADAIERVFASNLDEHAADLAHHLTQAGAPADPSKLIGYLRTAGDRSLETAAFGDALRAFEAALELQPSDDALGRAALLERLGFARRSQGDWNEALAAWQEALDLYTDADDEDAVGHLCHEIGLQLGWAGRWQDAIAIVQRGLAALGDRVNEDRCHLLALGGIMLSYAGAYEGGMEMVQESLRVARHLGDDGLVGFALEAQTVNHYGYMEHREAAEVAERAASLLRNAGQVWDLTNLLGFYQFSLSFLGRWDEADAVADEVDPLARRLGNLGSVLFTTRTSAITAFARTGDLGALDRAVAEDIELNRSADMPWISQSYAWMGTLRFLQGRWDEARRHFEESVKLEALIPGPFEGFCRSQQLVFLGYAGPREEALAAIEESRRLLPTPGRRNWWGPYSVALAMVEALSVLGEREQAAALYPVVRDAIATGTLWRTFDLRSNQAVAGTAAAAAGMYDGAEAHFEEALALAKRFPHAYGNADERCLYARMLLDRDGRGDRERARALVEEALAAYREAGMTKHVEIAEALLARAAGEG